MEQVISAREIQRNYRKLINKVNKTRQPIFLGKFYKPQAVLLSVESFEELRGWRPIRPKRSWAEIKKSLEKIRKSGKQNVNLSKFVIRDRQSH